MARLSMPTELYITSSMDAVGFLSALRGLSSGGEGKYGHELKTKCLRTTVF